MVLNSGSWLKNSVLFLFATFTACGNSVQPPTKITQSSTRTEVEVNDAIKTGADNFKVYLPLLQKKRVGIVTNQTGILTSGEHLVDFMLSKNIAVKSIYAPEHGFRGTADAGELVVDGKDSKTGLPVISLYGDNKKPKPAQLAGIDVMVFDLQDVGARFYTYISSLHYVMEACAEQKIPVIILDRPNPNGDLVDGPILEKEFKSFVGMHPIPVLHGMTIGEYGKMINGEKWLPNAMQCQLTVVPCLNYKKSMKYSLPVKPSPNLPNDQAVNLYASLCFFEGTNVSVGRGTNKQFQIYGSPYLPASDYSFTPEPNLGAKDPLYNGKKCNGHDLSGHVPVRRLEINWLIEAYSETSDKSKFFNTFFTKLAGTKELQNQIESGLSEKEIRNSWSSGLADFKIIRKNYEIY